ncbi:ATP-binding protein [Dactylosporangium sp. CA-139066]|uniref:ATP-binding protein n=1 Tax=Dactylosporangium sp. CA-139066 TaxID=3239930 RepID=UPI003D8A3968
MSIALRLALHLPRDAATVPLVRRLLDQALHTLGVAGGCRDDIGLILTEACANVIEHALQIDDYQITIEVSGERCVIHVINAGPVVDASRLVPAGSAARPAPAPAPAARRSVASSAASLLSAASPPVPEARLPSSDSRPAEGVSSGVGGAAGMVDVPGVGDAAGSRGAAWVGDPAAGNSAAGVGGTAGTDEAAGAADAVGGGDSGGAVPSAAEAATAGGSLPESPVPAARTPMGAADPLLDAVLDEHGRGLHIIRSLADELYVTPALSGGLVLQAVITLRWTADAEVWQRR